MVDFTKMPEEIKKRIEGLAWAYDEIGLSGSSILLFDEMVLKIEQRSRSSESERKLLEWLYGKLPIPRVIAAETKDACSYLLMSRLPGEMACSASNLEKMEQTVKALAKGIRTLWQIDTARCPCSNGIAERLVQAQSNIENGQVETDDFEIETFTTEGFSDVSDLYGYLEQNRPQEDLVFSHGDYCLPNVFVSGCEVTGFLDWGNGGIADRWQDIALCVRSLRHNCMEYAGYDEAAYQKYRTLFFSELGIAPDEEKIRYFILLDELF